MTGGRFRKSASRPNAGVRFRPNLFGGGSQFQPLFGILDLRCAQFLKDKLLLCLFQTVEPSDQFFARLNGRRKSGAKIVVRGDLF